MERYNPFAAESAGSLAHEPDPFSSSPVRRQLSSSSNSSGKQKKEVSIEEERRTSPSARYSTSFPDPFGEEPSAALPPPPPPLQLSSIGAAPLSSRPASNRQATMVASSTSGRATSGSSAGNRSNSVTFLHRIVDDGDDDDDDEEEDSEAALSAGLLSSTPTKHQRFAAQRDSARTPAASFGSFLSRATSVTSSSVSERVTGAVGSVRSAVDSLSSQIQSAVPANLSSTAANLKMAGPNLAPSQQAASTSSSPTCDAAAHQAGPTSTLDSQRQQQQQQQSAASYLASKFSSATNQFVAASNQAGSGGAMPTICRQRVVLILDAASSLDWAAQFQQQRRLVSSGGSSGASALAFSSFFGAQFSSASSQDGGADLIEQVDFADASVLANQPSSTCSVRVCGLSALAGAGSASSSGATNRLSMLTGAPASSGTSSAGASASSRIIRPEFVVVRQRGREKVEHLRSVVKALHYCLVPMLEPYDVWNIFQDRQLIFSKLLCVQRRLGKESFPLIAQIYCQTQQDLANYIRNSAVTLPCLVRTGPSGKGKIKIESLQMLRDFATIMATSQQSCTIEPFLDVKCDLVVQKLANSLKVFRRHQLAGSATREQLPSQQQQSGADSGGRPGAYGPARQAISMQQSQEVFALPSPMAKQAATRQSSLGSGVLSSLSSSLQQVTSSVGAAAGRRVSNPLASACAFEKLPEVSERHRQWMEAIEREFEHKLEAFSLKIVVASDEREYVVGLRNCSMEFLGSQENQEEDRRNFVELIISKMNLALPKQQPASRESSPAMASADTPLHQQARPALFDQAAVSQYLRRTSSDEQAKCQHLMMGQKSPGSLAERKSATFMSQTDVGAGGSARYAELAGNTRQQRVASSSQLNNRSRSVSMNQGESPMSSPLRAAKQTALMNGAHASGLNKSAFYARRSSDATDSQTTIEDDSLELDGAQGSSAAGNSGNLFGQRQFSLGQSIFEQTSSAFGSLQKQSMSFLKRLDSRTGSDLVGAGTPPMSAKSDTAFDRNFCTESRGRNTEVSSSSEPAGQRGAANGSARVGIKSQSVDAGSSSLETARGSARAPPPKPPPPPLQSLMNRQSSMVNYSSHSHGEARTPVTPNQTPRQNSAASLGSMDSPLGPSGLSQQRSQQRVVRQNSALSAFEPFDADLRSGLASANQQVGDADRAAKSTRSPLSGSEQSQQARELQADTNSPNRPAGAYDSASMTSGNSDETTTAEDTMNNLKKTFASIFGDKCE